MLPKTADFAAPSNWFFTFALALSAALISVTLTISNGFLEHNASGIVASGGVSLLLLTLSLLACLAAIVFHDAKLPAPRDVPLVRLLGDAPAVPILIGTGALQLLALAGRYANARAFSVPLAILFLLAAIMAFCWLFFSSVGNRRWTIKQLIFGVATLLCFVFCAAVILRGTAGDFADVMIFQRDSSRALAAGNNPYALTFPNIYGDDSNLYGAGISVNGRVQFGFPYFPISLLWVMPAQLLLGDFRYGHLFAVALAAVFIVTLRPSRLGAAAAMLLAFSAPAFFVLQVGWTEPVVSMLFCFNVWLLARRARGSSVALGLFLAAKQYLVFALPLLWILPRLHASTRNGAPGENAASENAARWQTLLIALGVATLTVLPFMLWNLRAFWWSVFALQFRQPFRDDALSYLAAFKAVSGVQLSSAICFLLAALSVWLCLKRAPRTVAGFAASVALVHFVFFASNKQAFANYYFFIFAALCCATAAAHSEFAEAKQGATRDMAAT